MDKVVIAKFFKTETGNEPVRDFLKDLAPDDRKTIGADIMAIEMAWPIGYPAVRKLDSNLWEVRSNISNKESAECFLRY
ncbi:type II toxin-antitoxin system RelE/ParE family toxin [Treponema denticola]|uniref:type II toxin-antitoxin system RelE/ParE family toxin n=1 Tax=Treponema denticola TaxID=158 RepID=UPI0020A2CE5C|nr:type II toxin-antitoxin system RelE/ParE family toxin [Treponema denticola]